MITISGRDIVPGGTNAPSLYDIGYALSQTSRFGGHTKHPWTVFQHLYAAGMLARFLELDKRIQLYALLHDAHEAIIGDIPNPWKTEDMKKYQHELDLRLYASLGIDPPDHADEKIIKHIDTMLLYAESEMIGPQKIGNAGDKAKDAVKQAIGLIFTPNGAGLFFENLITNLLENLIYVTR